MAAPRIAAPAAVALLVACAPLAPPAPAPAPVDAAPGPAPDSVRASPLPARRLAILPGESLLTVEVRRGGALARLGHNHVIGLRDLAGEVRLDADPASATFEWTQPVARLTVDEPALRAAAGADFAAPVPEDARAGTRANMTGPALLDMARFPAIRARGRVARLTGEGAAELAVEIELQSRTTPLLVPVRYRWRDAATLEVEGASELRQSALGLTPFSVMMGALQVEDLMQVRFRIVARLATEESR